jgi:amidase
MEIGSINLDETDLTKGWAPISAYVPFATLQNITGQPAINLPLAWSKAGLPIGVQIVAPIHSELACLQLAYAYELATNWTSTHLLSLLRPT